MPGSPQARQPHHAADPASRPTDAPTGDGAAAPRRGWTEADRAALVSLLPRLRAFARSLQPNPHAADDLLQDAVAKALGAAPPAPMAEGSGLAAWMFTIVRNHAFNLARRRRVEQRASDSLGQIDPPTAPPPDSLAEAHDLAAELARLPLAQREAVLLVGAHGFSYEEAATITGVAVGTVKARVARGRAAIARRLAAADGGAKGTGADCADGDTRR